MEFLKRIFRGEMSDKIDDEVLFAERLIAHRARITSASSEHSDFLMKYLSDETITLLAAMSAEKMRQTQIDGEEHSIALTKAPVCYVVCTICRKLERAADWFEQRYGGYTKVLEGCWNSPTFAGCQVLVHVTYGRVKSNAWINITIFPIRSIDFSFQPVIAIDLLSPTEKRISGVN